MQVPEAFPGLQTNLTSEAEAARRIGPNAVLTGQGDTKAQLQSYTLFQNMSTVYACPDPTQGALPAEGEMPACDVFQNAWGNWTAARHGYTPQWGSAAANEVRGTDGSMFGHPTEGGVIVTFQVRAGMDGVAVSGVHVCVRVRESKHITGPIQPGRKQPTY